MPSRDSADRTVLRLETRRFFTRCENQMSMIERADTLREISRLAHLPVPASLYDVLEARDIHRRLQLSAEQRARQLINDQIAAWLRAEQERRAKLRGQMLEDWSNLTGPLGHLRTWAQRQLTTAEQNLPDSG
ncbi:MAG: hypothetical protein JSR19_05990 [Proteobacteria bacterium]|nr:hypothetical protein [Pseudomonadota bacterium]HQR03776.1 hypothetical protein [Rhodocyclaceae bacterium]